LAWLAIACQAERADTDLNPTTRFLNSMPVENVLRAVQALWQLCRLYLSMISDAAAWA
jgi:hypothetical protein